MSRRLLLVVVTLAIAIGAHAQGGGVQSPDSTAGGSSASSSPSETLQEVTVTAQRATLTKRVTAFVGKITKPLFEGGLTLWHRPVCALVSGVAREDGEFILERISDVAHAEGISLGRENCHPNLFILVTKQPQEVLKRMSKRNVWFTFGFGARRAVIDEFISKPGPVRVLYRDFPSQPCLDPPCEAPTVSAAKVGPITMSGDSWDFDSQAARYTNVWQVFRVFVIVDASQMKGVTLGQFADYVALVSLAQLKPADSLQDAPTILKLFNGAPQAAPAGMTDWDRAFLKSIYSTDPTLHGQRQHIVQAMVGEIAH